MSHWTAGFHEAGGVTLHYVRSGGSGPPVVLLHGLAADGACWGPLARTLAAEFDLVMPDARGHGKSSTPPCAYRYEDHARDVMSLMGKLELVEPTLLGHSMGGMTATVVASQLGDTLRGLILADPTFLSPARQREVHESDVVEQQRRLLSQSREALIAELRSRHPHRSTEMVELLAEARLQTRLGAFDVLIPPNPDYRQLMSAIRVPVLLAIGDRPVVSIETARELQSLNPRVRIEQIPGAGHGLPHDQPELFAEIVRSFLATLPGPA